MTTKALREGLSFALDFQLSQRQIATVLALLDKPLSLREICAQTKQSPEAAQNTMSFLRLKQVVAIDKIQGKEYVYKLNDLK